MLWFMTGVFRLWVSLRVKSEQFRGDNLARRCGLKEISDVARVRRLQWFGHVQRKAPVGGGTPSKNVTKKTLDENN